MKIVFYYAALNPNGSSASIVERIKTKLDIVIDFRNVIEKQNSSDINGYDYIVFLTATYGDQELQDDIEKFVISITQDLTGKKFCVCELGNYYGYEDYFFGSAQIIENYLLSKNCNKHLQITSIDTLPRMDWRAVDHWIDRLGKNLK